MSLLKSYMLHFITNYTHSLTHSLTHSTEQSPSWEANKSWARQISHLLWNPKVHNCNHKILPPVPLLSQINPVHAPLPHPTLWRPILILSSHLYLGLSSGLFPSGFPTATLYTHLLNAISATCPPHLIHPNFIIHLTFSEEHRSEISFLCTLFHSPVTLSLLGSNIFLSALFLNILSLCSSLSVRPSFTPIQNNIQNYRSVYFNLYIFGEQTGRQMIPHWMIASVPWGHCYLNLFMNTFFIC